MDFVLEKNMLIHTCCMLMHLVSLSLLVGTTVDPCELGLMILLSWFCPQPYVRNPFMGMTSLDALPLFLSWCCNPSLPYGTISIDSSVESVRSVHVIHSAMNLLFALSYLVLWDLIMLLLIMSLSFIGASHSLKHSRHDHDMRTHIYNLMPYII